MGEILISLLSGGTLVITGIFMRIYLKREEKKNIGDDTE